MISTIPDVSIPFLMLPFHSSQVASDFSNYQLSKLMQRSRTSQKLADVRKVLRSSETTVIGLSEESKVHEVEASRIMSSDSAHYILVKGRELESPSQEDSLSQSSMEFPAIGESESDMDRRREEEEDEKEEQEKNVVEEEEVVMVEEKVVMVEEEKVVMVEEEKVVMVEEEKVVMGEEKVVMVEEEKVVMGEEEVVMVEEEKVVMGEEKVVMVEEEKVVMVEEEEKVVMVEEEKVVMVEEEERAVTESVTSEEREEASHALSQETDRSNLPVEPAASVVSEIKATPGETSPPTVSVMASVSERETTPRENCSLMSVVASASEMQGTPKEEEKSSSHVSTSEGVAASQLCEKPKEMREVLRDGRSFVEGVEEEKRLHLEEQLEREGEKEKEVKEEEGKERVKEGEKEESGKEEGGKEEKLEEGKKEEGKTLEQAVTIASSVKEREGSTSTLEGDNSASHLEEKEPADAGIHEGQTGMIDHGSSDKLDTTRLRTNPLETEWTKVVQLVGSRAREEGVREGDITEIDQSEVRVLEDQVGYISDSESGQSASCQSCYIMA